jgi:F0F1-type ATP synthase beta subunit
VLTSRSRLLDEKAVGDEHAAIAARVREALAALWKGADDCDPLLRERALKLQNYFTQPFYCAEPYTKRSGTTVGLTEALRTCREILDGAHDSVPTESFYFSGDLAEIKGNIGRQLTFGPVKPAAGACGSSATG